jgi:hypothetical protein
MLHSHARQIFGDRLATALLARVFRDGDFTLGCRRRCGGDLDLVEELNLVG